ncbi:MAG: DUF166 domain-containing protein [Methanomassiliicoccales archaeon]
MIDIEFSRPLSGEEVLHGLMVAAQKEGLTVRYLPVSVTYAGTRVEERRFTAISLPLSRGCATLLAGEVDDLMADREYREVSLDLPELDGEEREALEKVLRNLESNAELPPPPPPSEKGPQIPEYAPPPVGDLSEAYRVLVTVQGEYGERIMEHLEEMAPPHWELNRLDLPAELPPVVDHPEEYLPEDLQEADLVLLLSEDPNTGQLAPDLVRRSGAKGLIAPIDRGEWLPFGQVNQIKRQLDRWGVEHAFPRPFCALEGQGDPVVDEFASRFGRPAVSIENDGKRVTSVEVNRGSPCGCTEFVASHLEGERLDEAVEKAGLLHHHYPCLASMERERDLDDTLMHASGFLTKQCVEREVKPHIRKRAGYLDPRQFKR